MWKSINELPDIVDGEPQIVEVLIDNTEIAEAYYEENTWWIKLPPPAVGWQDYRTFDTDFEITNWRNKQNYLRQVDVFCEKLDKIFADGYPTKAQIIDAYHKSNPNSLSVIDGCIHPLKELRFHSDSTVSCKSCGLHSLTF